MRNKLVTDELVALRATKKGEQKSRAARAPEARRARSERGPVADTALWRAMSLRPHGPFSLLGQRD
ncbi:MAG TPA: hypothetical protein VJY39_13935 [Acidisphaera sp.]|nr:hypothetical protein [Acidisphaera sp.]